MILLRKAVVFEVGVQGVKAHSHKFRFAENWTKSLKFRERMGPNFAWLKKWCPRFAEKHMKTSFLEVTPKKVLMIFVGENL